ncbi:hypothetical protein TPA0908_47960 [Micromonospora sp. AKA38]|nr:hypothetical protein TPA0908_47960 [Micromonospora sp. AKA38]
MSDIDNDLAYGMHRRNNGAIRLSTVQPFVPLILQYVATDHGHGCHPFSHSAPRPAPVMRLTAFSARFVAATPVITGGDARVGCGTGAGWADNGAGRGWACGTGTAW